jgi:hypothetical protein
MTSTCPCPQDLSCSTINRRIESLHSLTTIESFAMEDRPVLLAPQPSEGEIRRLLERYPLPEENGKTVVLDYGTAGFRYKATILEPVVVRVGILAAYRSSQLRQNIASHGHLRRTMMSPDNGVKLADPHGGMMAPDGEALAVQLVNAPTAERIFQLLSVGTAATTTTTTSTASALPTPPALSMSDVIHDPHFASLDAALDTSCSSHGSPCSPTRGSDHSHSTLLCHDVQSAFLYHLSSLQDPMFRGYYDQIANAYMGLLHGIQNHGLQNTYGTTTTTTRATCGRLCLWRRVCFMCAA